MKGVSHNKSIPIKTFIHPTHAYTYKNLLYIEKKTIKPSYLASFTNSGILEFNYFKSVEFVRNFWILPSQILNLFERETKMIKTYKDIHKKSQLK